VLSPDAFARLLAAKLQGGAEEKGRNGGSGGGGVASASANTAGEVSTTTNDGGCNRLPVEGGAPVGTVRAAAAAARLAKTPRGAPAAAAALSGDGNPLSVVHLPPLPPQPHSRPRRSRSADAVVSPGRVNDAVADLDFTTMLSKTKAAAAAASPPPQPQLVAHEDGNDGNGNGNGSSGGSGGMSGCGNGGSSKRALDYALSSSVSPTRGRPKAVSAAVSHFDRRASTRSQLLRPNGRATSMGRALPAVNPTTSTCSAAAAASSSSGSASLSSRAPPLLSDEDNRAFIAEHAPAKMDPADGACADAANVAAATAAAAAQPPSQYDVQRLNNRRASSVDRLSSSTRSTIFGGRTNGGNVSRSNSNVSGDSSKSDNKKSAPPEPAASLTRSTLWERLPSSKLATLPKAPNEVAAWRAERRARRSRTKARNATIWALLAQGNLPAEAAPESLPEATSATSTAPSAAAATSFAPAPVAPVDEALVNEGVQSAAVSEVGPTTDEVPIAPPPPPPSTIAVSPMISTGPLLSSSISKGAEATFSSAAPVAETHVNEIAPPAVCTTAGSMHDDKSISSGDSGSQSTSVNVVPNKRFGVSQLRAWQPPPSPPPSPPPFRALAEVLHSIASPLEEAVLVAAEKVDDTALSSTTPTAQPEAARLVESEARAHLPNLGPDGSTSSGREGVNTKTSGLLLEDAAPETAPAAATTPPRRSSSVGRGTFQTPPSLGSSLRKRLLLDSPGMSRSGLGMHDNDDNFPLDNDHRCSQDELSVSERYRHLMSLEAGGVDASAGDNTTSYTSKAKVAAKDKDTATTSTSRATVATAGSKSTTVTSTRTTPAALSLPQPPKQRAIATATNRNEAARMSVMQQLNRARRARADASSASTATRNSAAGKHATATTAVGSTKSDLYSGDSAANTPVGFSEPAACAMAMTGAPSAILPSCSARGTSLLNAEDNTKRDQNEGEDEEEDARKAQLTAETLLAVEALAIERQRAAEAAENQAKAQAAEKAAAAQRAQDQADAVAAAAAAEAAAEAKQRWRDETVAAKLAREQAAAAQAAVEKTTAAKAAADAAFAAGNEAARQAQRAKLAAFQVRMSRRKTVLGGGDSFCPLALFLPGSVILCSFSWLLIFLSTFCVS